MRCMYFLYEVMVKFDSLPEKRESQALAKEFGGTARSRKENKAIGKKYLNLKNIMYVNKQNKSPLIKKKLKDKKKEKKKNKRREKEKQVLPVIELRTFYGTGGIVQWSTYTIKISNIFY